MTSIIRRNYRRWALGVAVAPCRSRFFVRSPPYHVFEAGVVDRPPLAVVIPALLPYQHLLATPLPTGICDRFPVPSALPST